MTRQELGKQEGQSQTPDAQLGDNGLDLKTPFSHQLNRRRWIGLVSNVAGSLVLPSGSSPVASLLSNGLSSLSGDELSKKLDAVTALDEEGLWGSICYHVSRYPFSAELTRIWADDADQEEDGVIHSEFRFFDNPLIADGIEGIPETRAQSLAQDATRVVRHNWYQRLPHSIQKILAIAEVASANLSRHHALLEPIYQECLRRMEVQDLDPNKCFYFDARQEDRFRLFQIEKSYCSPVHMQKAIEQLRRYAEHLASGTISEFIKDMPPEQQCAVHDLLPKAYVSSPAEEVQLKKQYRDSLARLLREHNATVTRHVTAEMLMYDIKNIGFENPLFIGTHVEDTQQIPDPRIGQLIRRIDSQTRYVEYASGLYSDEICKYSYKYPFPLELAFRNVDNEKTISPGIFIIEPDGMLQGLLENLLGDQ